MKIFFGLIFSLTVILGEFCNAQKSDSIVLFIKFSQEDYTFQVEQEFYLNIPQGLDHAYIHAWGNAYKSRDTKLAKTQLKSRNDKLYFASPEERGSLEYLDFRSLSNEKLHFSINEDEFVKVYPTNQLPDGRWYLKANYTVKLPSDKFTGYGVKKNGDVYAKYFFLQPATFEKNKYVLQHYEGFESVTANPSNYNVHFQPNKNFHFYTDLNRVNDNLNHCVAENFLIFELLVQNKKKSTVYKSPSEPIYYGYKTPWQDEKKTDSLLQVQMHFLKDRLGRINEPLYISEGEKRKYNFVGVDDINIPLLGTIKLFTDDQRIAMQLFPKIAHDYLGRSIKINDRKDNWIKNGLLYYLQIEYINEYFPELLLLGNLPEKIKLFGIRPLNYFDIAKLKMVDRYNKLVNYSERRNLDQAINTPFDQLSNLNQVAMSGYKAAMSFYYLSQYLGEDEFKKAVKYFVSNNVTSNKTGLEFIELLNKSTTKDISWFYEELINTDKRINFKINKATERDGYLLVSVENKTQFKGPFKISVYKNDSVAYEGWYRTVGEEVNIYVPGEGYDKVVLNKDVMLPEFSFEDNYHKINSLFNRQIRFKLVTDIGNPRFNDVFLNPTFEFNNYDKLLFGLGITNKTILRRLFTYKLEPQYSTGEGSLTGSAQVRYEFLPKNTIFRSIIPRLGYNYKHYNQGLAYRKLSSGLDFYFKKKYARSLRERAFFMSYENINRETPLDATEEQIELSKYNIFHTGFSYWNPQSIHEKKAFLKLEISNKFKKIYGEFFWRYQYKKRRFLSLRFFAGAFLSYNLDNTEYFDFGLDHITDYTFSYPLWGRSDRTGFFSQQYVQAEGGFKSGNFVFANEYMATTNFEFPLWRFIDLYADVGVYKQRQNSAEFVYDTGFRLRVIPDFFEVYLPMQSYLGFEPSQENYFKHLRFLLSFDLGKFFAYWRRGRY